MLATFISVLAAVGVGLLLFNYQIRVTDDRRRRDQVHLTATELNGIIQTLQRDVDLGSYRAVYVHCPMVEQAARSGILGPRTTAHMMRFAWNAQRHNQLVTQFNTVQYSMGVNPNANTFLRILLSMGRDNRNITLESAQAIIREILTKYPEAFPPD
jgi:hypothetical protein